MEDGGMPNIRWPLTGGRPSLEVVLTLALNGHPASRTLLADTGAGSRNSGFELILEEHDCVLCGGIPLSTVTLGGSYSGIFPIYVLLIQVPALGFAKHLRVAGVA